jgi:hypothetical protein
MAPRFCRRIGVILSVLGMAAALARLPLIRTPVDVSPDGCEYIGIARHVAGERHWVSSLKWHFFTDDPIIHPALADRAPLYPLWAAGWVALSPDPDRQIWLARFGNLLLAAALPAAIYWALCPAVTGTAAALAAFIFMLYPGFIRNSAQPLTEPLFLLLLFCSVGTFLRGRSARDWLVSGLLAGLAFLTRPSGLLLPLVYGAALLFRHSGVQACRRSGVQGGRSERLPELTPIDRTSNRWALLFVLGGFALPLLPYWCAVAVQTGSPFTSILRYNYSIRHIDEGTFYGFERSFEPPVAFVRSHFHELVRLVAQQWATMGSALGRSLQFLAPLVLFWRPLAWERSQAVLLGLALLNYLFHAMSWTVWGAARYMFPTYIIGIALLLDAPLRWGARDAGRRRLALGAVTVGVGLTVAACVEQDIRLFREKSRPSAGVHLGWAYARAGDRLEELPVGGVCASNQPWIINLLTRHPAVMAPRFQDARQLRRYLARYQPATLTLFVTEREPGDVATALKLVKDLWGTTQVRAELSDVLDLESTERRATGSVRQALLMFRIRQAKRPEDRVSERPDTPEGYRLRAPRGA